MALPLLLGILGAGLASQALVHGGAIPMYNRRRGERAQGILAGLGDDASIDDQRSALMGAGLLSPERFAEIGFEDQASNRDFFESLRLQQAGDSAAMDRLRESSRLSIAANMRQRAFDLASNGAFGIGTPMTGTEAPGPYQVGSALHIASQAISGIESGGNYQAVNPESGALGKYQVMPSSLSEWAPTYLGKAVTPEEFLASPELQEQLFAKRFGETMQQYGFADAASIWHSGRRLEQAAAAGADDGNMATVDYVQRALSSFQGIGAAQQATAARFTPELRQRVTSATNAIQVGNDILNYVAEAGAGRAFDPATKAGFKTQAELTLIPELQQLVNSGALQQGELEQFIEWIGDPTGMRLTDADIGKFQATLGAIQQNVVNSLQAAGVDPRAVFNAQINRPVLTQAQLLEPVEPYSPSRGGQQPPLMQPQQRPGVMQRQPADMDEIRRYLQGGR